MIIYKVGGFVEGANHACFFSTKRAARQYLKETTALYEFVDLTIDDWTIEPNRRGVVQAFNDFISMTCFNDGG